MKKFKPNAYLNESIQTNLYVLNELRKSYDKLTIDLEELSNVLNLSKRTISNRLSTGELKIKYIKVGNSMQAPIRFPIISVAEYLSQVLLDSEPYEEF